MMMSIASELFDIVVVTAIRFVVRFFASFLPSPWSWVTPAVIFAALLLLVGFWFMARGDADAGRQE